MSDPLEQILDCVARVVEERGALQHRLNVTMTENHQLRRQLARAEEAYKETLELNSELKGLVEAAERRVEQSERATRDHMART